MCRRQKNSLPLNMNGILITSVRTLVEHTTRWLVSSNAPRRGWKFIHICWMNQNLWQFDSLRYNYIFIDDVRIHESWNVSFIQMKRARFHVYFADEFCIQGLDKYENSHQVLMILTDSFNFLFIKSFCMHLICHFQDWVVNRIHKELNSVYFHNRIR